MSRHLSGREREREGEREGERERERKHLGRRTKYSSYDVDIGLNNILCVNVRAMALDFIVMPRSCSSSLLSR